MCHWLTVVYNKRGIVFYLITTHLVYHKVSYNWFKLLVFQDQLTLSLWKFVYWGCNVVNEGKG